MDQAITAKIREFVHEREWERFHSPKNLVRALAGETGELLAEFQWVDEEASWSAREDGELRAHVSEEMADVAIYLNRLADVLQIDLDQAINAKLTLNTSRYPVGQSKGRATKYTSLKEDS
ncbi:NTP pyrophosphatase (non-canonical NTP hydrolase) [Kribbella orskensis]|uniref:NTP pyrophosphatase (Non-canonical NTP hydrolase) n=1 Tax=Kribbella orskensis TaxID=2512216 RepID=A0ABY2BB24_9ACTN|nr:MULTISPECIES: nucleotide pyrophosphohydrolase [Kribbella]TCN32121.1 NTP pyrophosphatase (non-canonical NTP hydrolase) [Kribbella sp. VKM Ac-2500]TCO12140.1 NTP pyrophosphatase (non-canonical NTP hydrolase) [Kribbella orskensis]